MTITKRWIQRLLLLFLLLTLPACGLSQTLRSGTPTPAPPAQVQVTADEVARAMQADEFYSDYRGDLLEVTGKVKFVNQQGSSTQLELQTNLQTKVVCELANQTITARPGDLVTVQTMSANVERAPSTVLLKECRIP